MLLNLRQAIIQRVHDKNTDELVQVIHDSIGGDDKALPGLGVLFELIWENSSEEQQRTMGTTLWDHFQSSTKSS
ncbi:MAG: small acid-soluble spore protein [Paenibacillus sp.]|jgi:small acid-soluble spore protein I (minor)|nr:small acid-soluble spore protein [Paenibacillus sp.]